MLKRAENRLRLLGAFLLFSGLLSLLGIAVHFSPALLLAAAFIAAFGGAALLAGFVRRPAARARAAEPLVLDRIAPDWTAQLEALQTEARALQSQARRLIAERPHDPAEVRAEASEQLARQADAIVRQMEEAEESAERVRDGIEALRSGASAADPALSTLNELAARGNLLALNAAIAGARGDGGMLADFAESVRRFAVEARQAVQSVAAILDAGNRAADGAMRAAHAISPALKRVAEAAGQLQWAAERQRAAADEIPGDDAWYDDVVRLEAAARQLAAQSERFDLGEAA